MNKDLPFLGSKGQLTAAVTGLNVTPFRASLIASQDEFRACVRQSMGGMENEVHLFATDVVYKNRFKTTSLKSYPPFLYSLNSTQQYSNRIILYSALLSTALHYLAA